MNISSHLRIETKTLALQAVAIFSGTVRILRHEQKYEAHFLC